MGVGDPQGRRGDLAALVRRVPERGHTDDDREEEDRIHYPNYHHLGVVCYRLRWRSMVRPHAAHPIRRRPDRQLPHQRVQEGARGVARCDFSCRPIRESR